MEDNNKEVQKSAAYHGGFQYLDRLHDILQELNKTRVCDPYYPPPVIKGVSIFQFEKRLALLNDLFAELYPKMSKDDKQNHFEFKKLVQQKFDLEMKKVNMNSKTISFNTEFIDYFDGWELELRDIIEKNDLLMPEKNSWDYKKEVENDFPL